MTPQQLNAAAAKRLSELERGFREDLRGLREDAGISQRALAALSGIDQAEISRIETGRAHPRMETCVRLGLALGCDPSLRLFPNTGPPIRDRHQAPIVEALIATTGRRWRPWPEVGVRSPSRGWIDLVLAEREAGVLVAAEIVSVIQRFEQLLRWSGAKAEALPSAQQWPFGLDAPRVDRLLVLRSTRSNRTLAETFRTTLDAAYPGDPWQALAALRGTSTWPGSAVLWAAERRAGRVEIVASPAGMRHR